MKFEHIVEVNHPSVPAAQWLTLEQLWQGLILRATQPKLFVPHLDVCHICQLDENVVSRELHYGKLIISDQVHFIQQKTVHYAVPTQGEIAASSLHMHIETPQTDVMLVRFVYQDQQGEPQNPTDVMVNDFRRSAYLESDLDVIRIIRELAMTGGLTAH
ncbi:MAG: AtaL-like protein [Sulfuriferula sp.]